MSATAPDDSRRCPACRDPLSPERATCKCGLPVVVPPPDVDPETFDYVRMIVLEGVRRDTASLTQMLVKRYTLAAFLLVLVGVFSFDKLITAIVRAKFDGAVQESIGVAQDGVATLEEKSADLDEQLRALQDQSEAYAQAQTNLVGTLTDLEEQAEKSDDKTAQLHLKQVVRLRSDMDERTARSAVAPQGPRIFLQQPSSLAGERPETLYGRGDIPIRFAWTAPPDPGGEPFQFRVQIGKSSEFTAPSPVAVFKTPFLGIEPDPQEIAAQLEEERLCGVYYWRVLTADGAAKPAVGCFEYYRSALDRIEQTGEVRIGITSNEAPPFVYRRSDDSFELTGLDYGLAQEIATRLQDLSDPELDSGREPRVVVRMYDWLNLLSAPARNEVDFIVTSITIKDERRSLYAIEFSDPYHTTVQTLLLAEGTPAPRCLEDLHGMRLAAQKGTTGAAAATKYADPRLFRECGTTQEMLGLLANRQADAAIIDYEIAADWAGLYPGLLTQRMDRLTFGPDRAPVTSDDHPGLFDHYGIAVSQTETRLLNCINAILALLEETELPALRAAHIPAALDANLSTTAAAMSVGPPLATSAAHRRPSAPMATK